MIPSRFTDYSKSTNLHGEFLEHIARPFTERVGGDAKELTDILFAKYTVDDFAYHDDMYHYGVFEYFTQKVLKHKIAVYEAGKELLEHEYVTGILSMQTIGQIERNLWLHDLSKFSANEAFGYAMYDFNNPLHKDPKHPAKIGFEAAWHHHKMNNPHHPEYWLNPNRQGTLEPLRMPLNYMIEMLADWIGAGRTYGNILEVWLPKNIQTFRFAEPEVIAAMLCVFGYEVEVADKGEEGKRIYTK